MGLLSLFLIGAGMIQSCKQKEQKQLKDEPPVVTVATINSSETEQSVSYSGSIVPDNTTTVSFAVPGTINSVGVNEGQRVSKGQFLASIDATEYEAALQIANANLDQSEDAFRRFDELYKKGSFPEKDYIDIKTKVAQAQANKKINRKRIADSRLHSPSNGIITVKTAEVGGMAAPGVPAFTIVKTDMVYAQFSVPESEIGNFRQGMLVNVNIPTLQRNFTGKITIINPVADDVSKAFTLKVRLDNPGGVLMPGMITEVLAGVPVKIKQVRVPLTAIVNNVDKIPNVYVVDKNGSARLTRVTVGKIAGDEVIITNGLEENQTIILAGQSNVKDGQKVKTETASVTPSAPKSE
jgi:RND family efflux transporter MFP subunit